jgi:hypothetical protein
VVGMGARDAGGTRAAMVEMQRRRAAAEGEARWNRVAHEDA